MLQLILAPAGGGKTTYIMNLIRQYMQNGRKKITLIVPEQFTFMSEKAMLSDFEAREVNEIDVLSFTSLGEKLVGKPALHERRRIDDSAKAVLMAMALESVKDKLRLYGNHTQRRSVVSEFVALSSEFKQNALTTGEVRSVLAQSKDSLLKMKLSDIVTVLEAYDAMVEGSYFNPDDLLTELCSVIPQTDYFAQRLVFIDSFRGFTAQEYKVIENMLCSAETVYVTLCANDLKNSDDETDLFAHTKRTAQRLINIAKRAGASVAKPLCLSQNESETEFSPVSPEMAAIKNELFSNFPTVYDKECKNITLCRASDIYAECEFVACTAKKLIRENGYRCRDIAVIARDSSTYETLLRAALKKCGIPVFEDSRQPVDASPIVVLVESAINIAASGFSSELMMMYLKTGLTGFKTDEIADVENYCFLWKINGSAWLKEWTQNPDGFGEKSGEEQEQRLEYLNSLRRRMVEPLWVLGNNLKNTSGEKAAEQIYALLEKIDAAENLRTLASELALSGETALATELERMWNTVIDMLDSLETLLRGRNVTAKGVSEFFALMLKFQTLGNLPSGLDEIMIGSADRMRIGSPRAVFVVGASNGSFPAMPFAGGALTDKDRRKMHEMGLDFSDFGEYKMAEEKLICYSTFCCGREKLYVCCPERGIKGEQLAVSEIYSKIKKLFPLCGEINASEQDGLYFVEGKELAFEQLAKNKNEGNTLYSSLNEYFKKDKEFEGRLASLERAAGARNFAIEDKEAATALFGDNMFMSASRVESFHKCSFAYFLKYGIKAMPRKAAELDPMQRGNIIHYALERLLSEFKSDTLSQMSRKELFDFFKTILDEYLMSRLDGENRSERFIYLYEKLILSICDVAERLIKELGQSEFVPLDFELSIGKDGEIPPYEIKTKKGKISISGAIDRVDAAQINGKKYIRIVDYKSSGKDFELSDVVQGLNMQMFIYLFALWQNGKEKYGDFIPAGVLYYPAGSPSVSVQRNMTAENIENEKRKKCVTNGIVLDDSAVVIAMDKSECGLYVPAKIKKGRAEGSLIGLKQLEKLKEKADKILADIAQSLYDGKIEALPSYGKSYKKTCEYCDYKAVCAYESGIPTRELKDYDLKTVLEDLAKGEEKIELDG